MRRALPLALALAACAHPRPVLYPDDHLKSVGEPAARKDVDECLAQAKEYLKANPAKPIARKTARGSVAGAIMGGVSGLILGDFGKAVASGAAIGAAAGMTHGAFEAGSPDEIQRAYAQRCLGERGYAVIGWR